MASLGRSSRRAVDALLCPSCTSLRSAPVQRPFRPTFTVHPSIARQTVRARFASTSSTSNDGSASTTTVPPPPPLGGDAAAAAAVRRMNADQARKALEASRQRMYNERGKKSRSVVMYSIGTMVIALGATYAAVPLYRAFCSATGFGGTPMTDPTRFTPDRLYTTPESRDRKRITVHFEATAADTLPWKFEPQQRSVKVLPGETALAFYTAKNMGDKDLIGIATYNMTPEKIAPYFAKVECFCFEEQKIRAGEEVDLPVFFFIDRDIMDEMSLNNLDDVVLSYTFFKARRNEQGHLVPDASEEVIQKSQGFENYELAKKEHKLSPPPS
ncbi:hypothetical protein CI109_100595 [Kwoniella shandongensis]|uniref:Uncharacterized protein n=1 Tax=Kwoniella shandongensis TaxID=1734106 RepID=A0A5M6BZG9_9TREE|nr:uncharacterized protein CI109_003483 [Kwoniella shandongensis]KAA5528194.1 hypothetical protein CI109_003483 [Kwoniella shandongensis]